MGEKCWKIMFPLGNILELKFNSFTWSGRNCYEDYVVFEIMGSSSSYRFCKTDHDKEPFRAFGNVTMKHGRFNGWYYSSFQLEYKVKSLQCLESNSFACDDHECIPNEKVCDGVKDCKNGADEMKCGTFECIDGFKCDNNTCLEEELVCDGVVHCEDGTDEVGCDGVLSIEGVSKAKEKAISWLKQKRTSTWGWRENTHRAVVALYLASAASFNGTVLEEDLMAKEVELKIATALLRPTFTSTDLSMFINALLVTCHSPRQFYGNNLVKRLKEQVGESNNFTHPLSYLVLCNANESWPLKAISDLNSVLSSNSEYPFVKDLQAMAITALSCEANRSRGFDNGSNSTTATLYKNTIQHLKKLQAHDGSFGNLYTTALITQALLSSGQEHRRDWNLNATIKYIIKELNSSSVDFLAIYLTLPILNGKSLMDISYVNCSANPRKHGDDPVSDIGDYLGTKIRVQYSLYIGDEKDVVHSISLRVLENCTASKVMELAGVEDQKYKFEWKMMSGKMYIYEIANIKNDPEAGKFWLLHVGVSKSSESLTHLMKGPNEIAMEDGDHLVMWYKTATI
ncbi:cobalamin binding intrinsic factor-like isoform X2 [Argiope bruennichi]|nr:cobalamin binding intrinsic factor-like isoform X2 [Argiope bruennichi]